MLASLISERYAKALLRACQAEKALDAVGPQAAGLAAALAQAEGAARLLTDPFAEPEAKLAVLSGAFEGGPHPIFKAFLLAVLQQKRERFLPGILQAFAALRDEAEGRTEAAFGTARELPAGERQLLEKSLSQRLGREVTLKPYTDKELLGGAVLRVGDTVFDGSLRSRLQRLGQILREGQPPRPKGAPAGSAAGGAKTKPEAKGTKAEPAKAGKAGPSKPPKKTVTAGKKAAPKPKAAAKPAAKKKAQPKPAPAPKAAAKPAPKAKPAKADKADKAPKGKGASAAGKALAEKLLKKQF